MSTYFAKRTVGFYMTVLATVLAAISLVFYQSYQSVKSNAAMLVAAAIVVEVILVVASGMMGNRPILDFAPSLSALLLVAGMMVSLPPMIDGFGYLVSGLFTMDDMRGAVYFLGCGVAALILYIIPSFMSMSKK